METPIRQDLSLLAMDTSEELERLRRDMPTDLQQVKNLSSFLKEFASPDSYYRLDHASIFRSAMLNSFDKSVADKTTPELAQEVGKIAILLDSNAIKPKEDELQKLISFCVALSDSAALYKEWLGELKKLVA